MSLYSGLSGFGQGYGCEIGRHEMLLESLNELGTSITTGSHLLESNKGCRCILSAKISLCKPSSNQILFVRDQIVHHVSKGR